MRSYVPWICAGCMLLGVVGWGAQKALSYMGLSTPSVGVSKSQLSLLPYKIIGNYVIEPPAEGTTVR